MTSGEPTLRVDKWLWFARFFKSRSRAADIVTNGHLRVNGVHAGKAAQTVRVGDTLTFRQGREIRVVRVEALGHRRGPAEEARSLYADLAADSASESGQPARRQGRPSRNERRAARLSKRGALD